MGRFVLKQNTVKPWTGSSWLKGLKARPPYPKRSAYGRYRVKAKRAGTANTF